MRHDVVGARLRVTPGELFIPKNIPGSLMVEITTADGRPHPDATAISRGKHIEAVLRGPAFPAYRLLGLPNEPLMLPPIALPGEYQIDDIRMVDTESGEVLSMGSPSRVTTQVFSEVLVSQVVSRPLTLDEIEERGIYVDASSFSVVEFEASFILFGRSFPVRLPVVTPKFNDAIEVISVAERQARLVEAEQMNDRLGQALRLPEPLELPGLNMQIKAINFHRASVDEGDDLGGDDLIPALVVIPGNVGFLNQFFSVQVFTANAAPARSGISVHSLEAELIPPPGRDRIAGNEDDPIVAARVGPSGDQVLIRPIHGVGPDGEAGTADDTVRLQPGQTGVAELLVEGRREGLHAFDLRLRGILDGLAHGEVPVEGIASASVLVRNPRFSIAFSHPRTVRAGEPYTAALTIMNTSETPAHFVSASLNRASISGAELAENQSDHVALGSIDPGQSATAEFRLIARRTGFVGFSNLTGDTSLTGRFDLTLAVDERGVSLSADSIGYPEWVSLLPVEVRRAADRVLGQALSAATAAMLPPGVRRPSAATVRQRAIELVEAGQRLGHGDTPERTLLDLLLDWHGGRTQSLGFDQIMRETNAGAELRSAILDEMAATSDDSGLSWISARAADVAGRSERWGFAATDGAVIQPSISVVGATSELARAALPESGVYGGMNGTLAIVRDPAALGASLEAVFRMPAGGAADDVAWMTVDALGTGERVQWRATSHPSLDVCYRYFPAASPGMVTIDEGCVQASHDQLAVASTSFRELPPQILAVDQDLSVVVERPEPHCYGPSFQYFGQPRAYDNYGTLAFVLFSKPMPADLVEAAGAFRLDNGTSPTGVSLQPGGRVALINFRSGFGGFRDRQLSVAPSVRDPRGNGLGQLLFPIDSNADQGVAVNGRVFGATGEPVPNIPVTLTMHDYVATTGGCFARDVRSSQIMTDADGRFTFDFVMAGLSFSVSATDIRGLSDEAAAMLREAAPSGEIDPDEVARLITRDGAPELWFEGTEDAQRGSILLAQSIDRAVFRDLVPVGSPRLGSEVPIALRFRGRGTVSGTIYQSDGVTPVADAAVNLYPDRGSRELGRGVYSDGAGRFELAGVPLGELTVQVDTGDGRNRTLAARLDQPGQHLDLAIVLSEQPIPRGGLSGTVYDSDGVTPHPRAEVLLVLDRDTVIGYSVTDAHGRYELQSMPVGSYSLLAISSDGRRASARQPTAVQADIVTIRHVTLPGTAAVAGVVQFANGAPVAGALVAGGETIVTTATAGQFVLTGVPTGRTTIMAGLDVDLSRNIEWARIGSAAIDVLPGVTNYAVIRFSTAGRISGTVYDNRAPNNQPIPYTRVAAPSPSGTGFFWTDADESGRFSFAPMALRSWQVTAPSPQVVDQFGELIETIQEALASQAADQLEALMSELTSVLTSGPAPYQPPSGFGAANAELEVDGDTVVANIVFLQEGEISGQVINHLGVPIGARVTLSAVTIDERAAFRIGVVGEVMSDPATGTFSFGGVEIGPYVVTAQSPFYPRSVAVQGMTTAVAPDATNLVLAFPPTESAGARLTGVVMRDGAPAGAGVFVNVATGYQIQTIADGSFDTQIDLNAGTYLLHAVDQSGREGRTQIRVAAGVPAFAEITLLSEAGGLDLSVVDAVGAPAPGATVTVRLAGSDQGSTGTSDGNGLLALSNLTEGRYSATACRMTGQTQLCGTGTALVPATGRVPLALRLQAAGTITGRYVLADGTTPVASAQVSITRGQPVAIASTDGNGEFQVAGIPVGLYEIQASNAVTGRGARAQARISSAGEIVPVILREDPLAELTGAVISSDGSRYVPGVMVTLDPSSPIFESRTVTTDPAGMFSFPGVPPGALSLRARYVAADVVGSVNAIMPEGVTTFRVDVPLERRGNIIVYVEDADGTPEQASVHLNAVPALTVNTDVALGRAEFVQQPFSTYRLSVHSLDSARSRSIGIRDLQLSAAIPAATVTVRLSGVGQVSGTVLTDAGAPVSGAEVTLEVPPSPVLGPRLESDVTGVDGQFSFSNITPGSFRLRAVSGGLGATLNGEIEGDGDSVAATLSLTPSADISGRLLRADGQTVVPNADIAITYTSGSGLSPAVRTHTDSAGMFSFASIPEGPFVISAHVPHFDGVLLHRDEITSGETVIVLGDLLLDEESPTVIEVIPADGETEVSVEAPIRVTFSEEMDVLFDDPLTAFVTDSVGVHVPATLSWENIAGEPRTLLMTPLEALESETSYTVVITGPGQPALTGGIGDSGPTDRAGRSMLAPFMATFTTIDSIPPAIESFTPEDGAEQIDPASVVRLTFSEPMDPASLQITLRRSSGALVPATVTMGMNDRLLVLTPDQYLDPNSSYAVELTSGTDRAGNILPDLPSIHGFATLDTMGPVIIDLAALSPPTTGAVVRFAASLASPEPGVQIRASIDLQSFVLSAPDDASVTLALGGAGDFTVHAWAIDRFGNVGAPHSQVFNAAANVAPAISRVEKTQPTGAAILSGQAYQIAVEATDDSAVSRVFARLEGAIELAVEGPGSPLLVQGIAPATLGPGSSTTLYVTAQDNSGESTSTSVTYAIEDGASPAVSLAGPGRALQPGEIVPITVTVNDAFGVTALNLEVTGAATFSGAGTINGSPTQQVETFDVQIPSDAPSSQPVLVYASTYDATGNHGTATLELTIADVVVPMVTSVSPANGTTNVAVGSSVVVNFSEPVTGVNGSSFYLVAAGSVVPATVTLASNGLSAVLNPTNALGPNVEHQMVLETSITDQSGLALTAHQSVFTTEDVDLVGPQLIAIRPSDASTNVSLAPLLEYEFDEPLDASSFTTADFVLEEAGTTTVLTTSSRTYTDEGRTVRFAVPYQALRPGTTYTATVRGQPRDAAQNAALDLNGQPWFEVSSTFTTAAIDLELRIGAYLNDPPRVVEGHEATARLVAESGAPVTRAEWWIDGASLAFTYGSAPQIAISPRMLVGTAPETATLEAEASVLRAGGFAAAPLTFVIEPRAADADGDGFTNSVEAAAGTNPFAHDSGEDPDLDTLLNADEIALGTNPHNPDSDGDGIGDAADLTPLGSNRPPVVGLSVPSEASVALRFFADGMRSFDIPEAVSLESSVTLELWAYPQTNTGMTILGSAANPRAINLGYDATATRFTVSLLTSGSPVVQHAAQVTSAINAWHHLAVTYDGQRVRLFVDGQLAVSEAQTGPLDDGAGQLGIASDYYGYIDEVRVWSFARSASSIQGMMHRGLEGAVAGLLASYRFQNTANYGLDSTVNGNSATVGSPSQIGGHIHLYRDRVLQLSGGSVSFTTGSYDPDGNTLTRRISRLPTRGTLYLSSVNGSEVTQATTLGINDTQFVYVAEPGYFGGDDMELIASDGLTDSVPLRVEFTPPGVKTWVGSHPSLPTAWSEGTNWSPVGVPSDFDIVVIPDGSTVRLEQNETVAGLYVGIGSEVTLDASSIPALQLIVAGHAVCDGLVDGDGFVRLSRHDSLLRGSFRNVRVVSRVALAGDVTLSGSLEVLAGSLNLSSHTMVVEGALTVSGGGVRMAHEEDELEVLGDTLWSGGSSTLTNGVIRAHGRFVVQGTGAYFAASDAHEVQILGDETNIRMDRAALLQGYNSFRHLSIVAPAVIIEEPQNQNIYTRWLAVTGDLTIGTSQSSSSVTAAPGSSSLVVGGALHLLSGSSLTIGTVNVAGALNVASSANLSVGTRASLVSLQDVFGTLSAETLELRAGTLSPPSGSNLLFSDLLLTGPVGLSADFVVPRDMVVTSGSIFTMGGHRLDVGRDLRVQSGHVVMTNAQDILEVFGDIVWNDATAGNAAVLSAGVIRAHARFAVEGNTSTSFRATGTHLVELVSPTLPGRSSSLRMDNSRWDRNSFRNLRVLSESVSIEQSGYVLTPPRLAVVTGWLEVGAPSGQQTSILTIAPRTNAQWFEVVGGVTLYPLGEVIVQSGATLTFGSCANDGGTATGFACP